MNIDAARAGYRIAEVELDLEHRATGKTLRGFLHRFRQLADFAAVYRAAGGVGGLRARPAVERPAANLRPPVGRWPARPALACRHALPRPSRRPSDVSSCDEPVRHGDRGCARAAVL